MSTTAPTVTGASGPADVVLSDATYLDVRRGIWQTGDIVVREGHISAVGEAENERADTAGIPTVSMTGRRVLPGLIDCHVHVAAINAHLASLEDESASYVALGAAAHMGAMLDRGFTTVRDMGGADHGLRRAQQEGLLRGPRLLFAGKALSQTGGHGDGRPAGRQLWDPHACCPTISRIADGVSEVRRAVRDELRKGADHIKLMLSGGVASPTDRIDSTQYSLDEIRAAVEEAQAANRYVAGHAYTPRAIMRALECGVRSIEHGNLLDDECVEALASHDAFVTMNLVTYWALDREGRSVGLPPDQSAKIEAVLDGGIQALKRVHAAGVLPAFGTDLLGPMQRHQAQEFAIRAQHVPMIDVIRSATVVAARLTRLEGQIGELVPGAVADLVVVDEDPLADATVLAESRLRAVLQAGRVVSGEL